MMGGLRTEILILRRQQLNVLRRNTGGLGKMKSTAISAVLRL
jgi:hypothetical protein